MKSEWLHRNGSRRLIVFCNGWGMDGTPFGALTAKDYDVLMFYDYRDESESPDFDEVFRPYRDISLVAWSMGVAAAQYLFSLWGGAFIRGIAINGTPFPVHDLYGIPSRIFEKTRSALAGDETVREGERSKEDTLCRFYQGMFTSEDEYLGFIAERPKRSFENIQEELLSLETLSEGLAEIPYNVCYDSVLISSKDRIFPTKNQHRFWKSAMAMNIDVTEIESGHFPFFKWRSWEEVLGAPSGR